MGSCSSLEAQRNRKIQKQLDNDFWEDQRSVKLLLLGPGECGKSTILKQMRILHMNGFDKSQLLEYRMIIYSNLTTSMQDILAAMEVHSIQLENPQLEKDRLIVLDALQKNALMMDFTNAIYNAIKNLWADAGVQKCYERRTEFQLIDSAKYFFDKMDEIHQLDYIPSVQDALMARAATTGIVEVMFQHQGVLFRVFDVGGQRSERRKWIHCFDQVNALIFIVAVSEYDVVMREDATQNRMDDASNLFGEIANSKWFRRADIILFMNKRDLFEEKIKANIPITTAFPEYKGAQTYDACLGYISDHFLGLNQNPDKVITVHDTCATDTDQVQIVVEQIVAMIIEKNLKTAGLAA